MTSLLETGWSAAGGYFDKYVDDIVWCSNHVQRRVDYVVSFCRYQRNVVGAVLMDPYDPKNPLDYESLLLEQASRHVYQLPHFQGMYIDSLGLSEVYDTANDDGDALFLCAFLVWWRAMVWVLLMS